MASTIASLSVLVACGSSGDGVDERSFERGLIEREHLTQEEADCVGGYVYAAYTPEEIRQIRDDGISSLPSPRWAEYGHALVGCMFHDELAGGGSSTSPAAPGAGP